MKKDNKGFSLVELIIVIAIMAVLIGILAPTYLKFVKRSKVSTDITNAQEIATAINVAISDPLNTTAKVGTTAVKSGTPSTPATATGTTIAVTDLDGMTNIGASKVDATYTWVITWNQTEGVTQITLGGQEIYPDASAYQTANQ